LDMTARFENVIDILKERNHPEIFDFQSRRLVEMMGNIIIGYLLLQDSNRNDNYEYTARVFIRMGNAQNHERENYIIDFTVNDLAAFQTNK